MYQELEDQIPAKFSSEPNKTLLNQLIKVFRIFLAGVMKQIEAK